MADIDLQRHAVVEASAGTGKTHTLEELVLRLLLEEAATLDEILVVTYTEKATGELKARLRQRLEKEQATGGLARHLLQAALDGFDQSHVYTIHGFCQRALQEHAFENRQEFRMQLVDDRQLLDPCLREIQRRSWPAAYAEQLHEILQLSGFGSGEAWEQLVRRVALSFRPGCAHLLRPSLLEDWPRCVAGAKAELCAYRARWAKMAGIKPDAPSSEQVWNVGFAKLEYHRDWRESRRAKVLEPLLLWLMDAAVDQAPIAAFGALLSQCRQQASFPERGFHVLARALTDKAFAQLADCCPNLCEVVDELEQLQSGQQWTALKHQLAVSTISALQQQLAGHKRERGLQSFEDMLTCLDDALDKKKNPQAATLCARLRRRFRYAIVDEFQDTDPIQWRIFKRIFVDGTQQHRLFVVGDPKQAIFGFRGADLQAYLEARKELADEFEGATYPLTVCWRSCPELLAALNDLFIKSKWFDPDGIGFIPAQYPEKDQPNVLLADATPRAALTAVDMAEPDKLSTAKRSFARFIAQEIPRLLRQPDGAPALKAQLKGKAPRALDYGDICILVFKRKEANPVLAALREAKIPYSFYKQQGLWQSDEALHVHYLLRALSRPEEIESFHKALLTRFFRIGPEELSQCEELPPDHAVKQQFDDWVGLAEGRKWGQLVRSLLHDSGLALHESRFPDADRRLANYRHIFESLAQAAYERDLDLVGVLDLLRDKRLRSDEETDFQPVETEKPKVKIMTIHASKGLEFPIVFLAGGFTAGAAAQVCTYRDPETRRLVFDLAPDGNAKEAYKRERDAEQRRLLYVALTRAIFKLYLPVVDRAKPYPSKGPVVTILSPAVHEANVPLIKPADPDQLAAGQAAAKMYQATTVPEAPRLNVEAFPRIDQNLARRRIRVRSFSSLHRASVLKAHDETRFADDMPRADEADVEPPAQENVLRGVVFGNLLHDVLEEIDYDAVGEATCPDDLLRTPSLTQTCIDDQVKWYAPQLSSRLPLPELVAQCRQQVAALVWPALHTPLGKLGRPLWQVPREDRLHELEFHYPEVEGPPPPEVGREEGFLTGFMDLVLRRDEKFFLVDWKTNFLPGYGVDEVKQSMRDSEYDRQYRLYLQALARWLRRARGRGFDFARDFGGVYYLYLRGLNGKDESTGVFFCKPTEEDLRLKLVLNH